MSTEVSYSWRGPITDDEMVDLVQSHGGRTEAGLIRLYGDGEGEGAGAGDG